MTRSRPRWVPIAAYSSIFVLLAIGLAVTIPAGNRIQAAPQMPVVGDVGGGAEACLGDRVAAVQSGVFLDIHVVGSSGSGDRDLGPKLLGGRIERLTGAVEMTGTCAPESDLGAVAASATAVVIDAEGLGGELVAGAATMGLEIVPADLSVASGEEMEELHGGELLSRVLLAVAIIIAAARVLGTAFRRIGQPRVIGEITAGILLGPSLLGLFFPEITDYLFPAAVTDVMAVLAQFGLIFFMFLIGLELDHSLIRGSGHTAVLISHYSIVVPLGLGMGAALLLYPMVASGQFTGFALFMGAAMAITAFPVLARILTDTGVHRTRLGALAITCAAVDDVTAWCVLAIVVAIVRAGGPADALTTIGLSVLFIVVMLRVVRPLAVRLMAARRGPFNATVMSFLIAGLFLSAWTTEMIGIHAIFGAFMFGAVLPRDRGVATQIVERLEDVTVLFLLPVFFAVVGLSTQIGLVSGGELWLLTGLVIVIAIVGKIGGSVIAGLAAGETLRSSTIIGVLMNARGITEIVILTIGMELGVISPALFTIMVLMALTTTFMTTPILSRLYPREAVERDVLVEQRRSVAHRDYAERRVMVGVTDPDTARPLVKVAGWLRGDDGRPSTVVLASVIAPPGHEHVRANIGDFAETSAAAAANLAVVANELDRQGVGAEVVTRIGTDRGEELRLLIDQQAIDLVVVGSHQSYLRNRPLAGLVEELLRTAPTDVVVAVNADKLLAPGDGPVGVWLPGGPADPAVLDLATSLARGLDRPLRAVAVAGAEAAGSVGGLVELPAGTDPEAVKAAFDEVALLVVAVPLHDDGLDVDVVEAVTESSDIPVLALRLAQEAAVRAGSM